MLNCRSGVITMCGGWSSTIAVLEWVESSAGVAATVAVVGPSTRLIGVSIGLGCDSHLSAVLPLNADGTEKGIEAWSVGACAGCADEALSNL